MQFIDKSRRRSAKSGLDDTVIAVRPTPGLAAQAYLDEVLIAVMRHPDLLPRRSDYQPAANELAAMQELCAARGWRDDPKTYHRDPPPPDDLEWHNEHSLGLHFEHVTFRSGWEPDAAAPGRARWLGHVANRTMHARIARAPGAESSSWLVCAHGFGMGTSATMDLRAFRAGQMHRAGVNVVVPVLPLHGPRSSGRVRGEDLMTIDMVDSLHGMAQATWDLRRLIRWLRDTQGAERVGIVGYSLGALVAALVASLEPDLACVIAGIPVIDLPDLFRRHSPPNIARLAERHGVLGAAADEVHRMVSPLAMDCVIPFERRYIFAGLGDRMSTFGHARRLWLHWGRPTMCTYAGGHVGFYLSGAVKRFVEETVAASLTPERPLGVASSPART